MSEARDVDATWYEATADRGRTLAPLTGKTEADVCIVGGGLAGLTTALELARRGVPVVLLEAKRLAWGASGRNGGFVSHGFSGSMDQVSARVGLDSAKALYKLSRFGTEYVRREIAESDPTIKMGEGKLECYRYNNPDEVKAYAAAMARDFDHHLTCFAPPETRSKVRTADYFQSILDPSAFQVHPLRYALMIAGKAEAEGVLLHEMSPVQSVSREGTAFRVRAVHGEVTCREVVYSVSALDRRLHPLTGRAILPVATYVAVTDQVKEQIITAPLAVSDQRKANNYYRMVGENRLLWGGAITTRVSAPARLAERMKRDMVSVFPQLGNPRIDYAWAGLMGYTRHFMPLIGSDGQGQWWATAFGGHGMNTTAMGGILLARAIAQKDDEYRRFLPFTPDWAGGPFGRVAVQLGYWSMQVRDKLDEARSQLRKE